MIGRGAGLAALLLAASPASAIAQSAPPLVSVDEIRQHPERYDGKRVRIRAYLVARPEAVYLYQSRAQLRLWQRHFDDPKRETRLSEFTAHCLSIENAVFGTGYARGLHHRTVTIEGRIDAKWMDPATDIALWSAGCDNPGLFVDVAAFDRAYGPRLDLSRRQTGD